MTESAWSPITIHRVDRSIEVRVEAPTPQAAAEALDPYVRDDVFFAGASTSRAAAVHAILQTRLIASRADLERAQAAYEADWAAIQELTATDAAQPAQEPEAPAADVG